MNFLKDLKTLITIIATEIRNDHVNANLFLLFFSDFRS